MLEVIDLVVAYDQNIALNGFSLEAQAGRITTVLGSNGAGKSTLLKGIVGLVSIKSGVIRALGEPVQGLSTSDIVRHGVSLVPEGRELFPRMSVYDNLISGSYLRSDKAGVRRDLDRVYAYFPALKTKAQTMARNLSGGEQQMVAFGRALMAAPKVLLLDEPSIGLAPLVEQQLMRTLRTLTDDAGITVVLVEQNAALALDISDDAYVLELGALVLKGPAKQLLQDDKVRTAYLGV